LEKLPGFVFVVVVVFFFVFFNMSLCDHGLIVGMSTNLPVVQKEYKH